MGLIRSLVVRTFYKEMLLAIGAVLLGFFLVLVTMDGLNEARSLGQKDYTMGTLIGVVLLGTPDYIYRLLPICTLIGGVLALSNMAARSELIVWRASGLSVRQMVAIVVSLGAVLALVVALLGELGIAKADATARSMKSVALQTDQYFKKEGGFWGRQNLPNGGVRMINVRTIVKGNTLKDIRLYELTPDFALKSISTAQTATETQKLGVWTFSDVHQVQLELNPTGVVAGQTTQTLPQQMVDLGDYSLESIRFRGSSYVALPLSQLRARIQTAQETGQNSREFELGYWQKIFYPLSIVVMLLLALPFAFMQTRKGGVGLRVMTGIFLGLLFFILNAMVQFLGPLLSFAPALVAVTPVVLFFIIALLWLWNVTRVA
jgi:lipopolysaccharide export system permease protein